MTLVNLKVSSFLLLSQLNHSSFKFYLTGSRFFGYPHASSDWDFFTQTDPRVEQYLKGKGFKRIPMNPDWIDPITDIVYRHQDDVEVALVNNVDLKKRAQYYIRDIEPDLIEIMRTKENQLQLWIDVYSKLLRANDELLRSIDTAKESEEGISFRLER